MVPPKPKFIAYFRVSTERQGRSGLGLEAQQDSVARSLANQQGALVATDVSRNLFLEHGWKLPKA